MQDLLLQLLLFALSAFALIVSSRWIVESSKKIASILKINEFTIGFVFLAIGTSLPELVIAIIASSQGAGMLVVGNVLGANISDILLVLGISALIGVIHIETKQLLSNAEILLFITLIPLFLLWKGSIGFFSGMVLLVVFVLYLFAISKNRSTVAEHGAVSVGRKWPPFVIFALGLTVLLFSSNILVSAAIGIAEAINISQTVIGLTVVAIGTTIAELVVSVQAMLKKSHSLALGNIFGSCVVNLTLVLGIAAIIKETTFDYASAGAATMILVGSTVFLTYLLNKHNRIDKKHGIMLLAIYLIFIAIESGITLFPAIPNI